jgi:hypothetical protein
MTMRLAMYKGPPDDFWHGVGHTATRLWTRSRYSHCELVFGEPDADGKSLCASSSARDGGVRFKRIDLGSGRWDVYDLPGFDAFDAAYARQWFHDHAGLPYDHLGLLWFVLPIGKFNHPARFVCSEACAAALRLPKPHKYHPQRLLDAVKKD